MMLDSAVSEARRADFNGFTVVGADMSDNWYVLEADAFKGPVDAVIARAVSHAIRYRPRIFAIDAIGAQRLYRQLIEAEFRRVGISLAIQEYAKGPTVSKRARIESLQPRFKQGKIFLKVGQNELIDQLEGWPDLDHDDLLDSLAMHKDYSRPANPKQLYINRDFEEDYDEEVQERGPRLDGTHVGLSTPRR